MKKMKRAVVIVLDGAGAGSQADAAKYGDTGADTLGHVIAQLHPDIPNLTELRTLPFGGKDVRNIDYAVFKIAESTLHYLRSTGKEIDPQTEKTMSYYKRLSS